MNRIEDCFARLRREGRKAFVAFTTAGDADGNTVALMHAMAAAGVDLIELGVPFSDPEADGPVIQASSERALRNGMTTARVMEMVAEFREDDTRTPVILMGYLNTIETMGYEAFAAAAASSGVDGTITVNLPPEEGADLDASLHRAGICPIYLLAPTTPVERAAKIIAASRGFVYYVSLKGSTGSTALDVAGVKRKLREFRGLGELPIVVGFGIKDAESAVRVSAFADGIVIGSAIVDIVGKSHAAEISPIEGVSTFVRTIGSALAQQGGGRSDG